MTLRKFLWHPESFYDTKKVFYDTKKVFYDTQKYNEPLILIPPPIRQEGNGFEGSHSSKILFNGYSINSMKKKKAAEAFINEEEDMCHLNAI